jgi:hypothetical protein
MAMALVMAKEAMTTETRVVGERWQWQQRDKVVGVKESGGSGDN